jgi:2-phosphosulfolactate phosphatase
LKEDDGEERDVKGGKARGGRYMTMEIRLDSLLAGARRASGTAVIVDVFRAFTCAPFMFALGLKRSILAATPREAFDLKEEHPDFILVGEVGGIPVEGFDLGNSPMEILRLGRAYFDGKTAVQRTSAGVQGALAAIEVSDQVLLASYVTAAATARYILSKRPGRVSIVGMGIELKEKAPEDEWCARYIAGLLGRPGYDHLEALSEILRHDTTRKFLDSGQPVFPVEDPFLCLQRDLFDFALEAYRDGGLVAVRKAIV